MLRFDAGIHSYTWHGQKVNSVTGVLKRAGYSDFSFVPPATLEAARIRGTSVHDFAESWFRGAPTDYSDSPYRGYIESFLRWAEAVRVEPWLVEQHVCSPRLWCAGRFDVFGLSSGKVGMIDLKSGDGDFEQPAGYQLLAAETQRRGEFTVDLRPEIWLSARRVLVCLRKDGKMARQRESTDPLDFHRFERAAIEAREGGIR